MSLDGRHVAALLPFCDTTGEMRRVVARELTVRVALRGGAAAAAEPYRKLVLALLSECEEEAAAEVCAAAERHLRAVFAGGGENDGGGGGGGGGDAEISGRGGSVAEALAALQSMLTGTAPEVLEGVRVQRLKRWVRNGDGYQSRAHAERFFATLQRHGAASMRQFEVVLALCTTSDEMRARIGAFSEQSGLGPTAPVWNMLVERMLLEGDRAGAAGVVDAMAMEGQGNDVVDALLQRSEEVWTAARLDALRERSWQLASRGGRSGRDNRSGSDDTGTGGGGGGVADIQGSGGTLDAQQRVRALFEAMLSNNVATSEHLAEVVRACASSNDMRDTIHTYMGTGNNIHSISTTNHSPVTPGHEPFVELVKQLLIEGDAEAARHVLESEVPQATNAPAPQWMSRALSSSEEILPAAQSELLQQILRGEARHAFTNTKGQSLKTKRRTKKQQRRQQQNAQPSAELAAANANLFLRRMCRRGVATASHFNACLKATSQHSDSTRFIMENTMAANGVRPDAGTFLILVKQLVMEGEADAAREVADSIMPQALGVAAMGSREGIKDSHSQRLRKQEQGIQFWLSRAPKDLSRMRTARMKSMLTEGGTQSDLNRSRVRDFYERLLASGAADKFQWNQYLMALDTSDEIRAALEAQTELAREEVAEMTGRNRGDGANVAAFSPTEMDWATLVSRLILEGDVVGAEKVARSDAVARMVDAPTNLCEAALTRARGQGREALARKQIAHLVSLWEVDVAEFGHHQRREAATWFFERVRQNFNNKRHIEARGHVGAARAADANAAAAAAAATDGDSHSLVGQFGVLLKFCSTAAEMRSMVDDPPPGVIVTEGHLNAVINRLVLEGDDAGAMALTGSFPERGLTPNNRTAQALAQTGGDLSAMRAALLHNGGQRNWHRLEQGGKMGGIAAAAQRERALAMWEVLRRNGKMDTRAANRLMRWVCESSEDIKDFAAGENALAAVGGAAAGGGGGDDGGDGEEAQILITADAESYGNLVQQLVLEGDYDAAREVVDIEMPAAGIAAGSLPGAARSLLDASADGKDTTLSRMRTSMLCRWADEGTGEATAQALSFFDELKRNQKTDAFKYNVMMSRFCPTSDDVKHVIEEDMTHQGIELDASMVNVLARRLVAEGKFDEAQRVLDEFVDTNPNAGQWRRLVFNKRQYRLDLI
jgi:hypothetical protein